MSLLILKETTGLGYDIILSEGMVKRASHNDTTDFSFGVGGCYKSVNPLLELYSRDIPCLVPEKHARSFEECQYKGLVPWSKVIPAPQFKTLLRTFIESLSDSISAIADSPYPSFFCETNKLFSMLVSATLDKGKCVKFLDENDNHVLRSMVDKSDSSGVLPLPVYNRVSTKTGRLVVKEGPQILTMKKEHREVFVPRVPGNKLYEIDFTSLEPRVALNISGKECSADVYSSFAEDSGMEVDRDTAKLAVLCSLYGAGRYRLEKLLQKNASPIKAHALLEAVKEYFSIKDLSSRLQEEAEAGYITNCFGRPIEVDDRRDSMLINNFLQSSASDIAISGFLDFCRTLEKYVSPVFIIHDALVFEASPKHSAIIKEYVDKGYHLKEMGNFPLKITEFGSHE